jgi:archaellin
MFGLTEKLHRIFKLLNRNQRGFTAVQAVICSAALLGTSATVAGGIIASGAEASDRTEDKINETIQHIQSTFMLKGSVVAMAEETGSRGKVSQIIFSVSLVTEGGAADFTPPSPDEENSGTAGPHSDNVIVISYIDEYQHSDNVFWTVKKLGRDDGDYLLETNELFQITIGGDLQPGKNGGNLVDLLDYDLTTYTPFNIQVGAPQGAMLEFERSTPASLNRCSNLR